MKRNSDNDNYDDLNSESQLNKKYKNNDSENDFARLKVGFKCTKQNDYENMIKYHTIAVEKGNSTAMFELGLYYDEQKDYENMKKNYMMAIEQGNTNAMTNLAFYYDEQKDYENMMKYYVMAIKEGNYYATYNLGSYFDKQNDYKKEDNDAMYHLGCYYYDQNDCENMIKYFEMAINAGYELDKITSKINKYLYESEHDNFENLFLCKKYLNNRNLKKMNKFFKIYYDYKSLGKNVIDTIDEYSANIDVIDGCDVCFKFLEHLDIPCKHKICYECYDKYHRCPVCKTDYVSFYEKY